MPLSDPQKRHLRSLGHHVKPVVRLGQHGLTDSVLLEIDHALRAHELIKVKITAERATRSVTAAEICAKTEADLIQQIGQMLLLFRRNPDRLRIALPSV